MVDGVSHLVVGNTRLVSSTPCDGWGKRRCCGGVEVEVRAAMREKDMLDPEEARSSLGNRLV